MRTVTVLAAALIIVQQAQLCEYNICAVLASQKHFLLRFQILNGEAPGEMHLASLALGALAVGNRVHTRLRRVIPHAAHEIVDSNAKVAGSGIVRSNVAPPATSTLSTKKRSMSALFVRNPTP